jgi:hypothetical protein
MISFAGLLLTGCTSLIDPPTAGSGAAVFVEGEIVQQTGSRLSRVVKKGHPAGISRDMPGGIIGSGMLAKEQNDINSEGPLRGR